VPKLCKLIGFIVSVLSRNIGFEAGVSIVTLNARSNIILAMVGDRHRKFESNCSVRKVTKSQGSVKVNWDFKNMNLVLF